MKWILTGLGTLYCNLVGALMVLFAVAFLVGCIVAIVCWEPAEGGDETDEDTEQVPQPEGHY